MLFSVLEGNLEYGNCWWDIMVPGVRGSVS